MNKKVNRFMELEGLRGLAAVSVVLAHFGFLFYPALRDGNMALAHTRFEDNIYGTPLMLFFAGTLAVSVFFVLSGFVLSIAYFQTRDESIVKKLAANRYLRLMLPALASVLIAFSLISFGVSSITQSAGEIANSSYLASKWDNDVNIFEAIATGTVGIFVEGPHNAVPINAVLWTMHTEFLGSFLVFGFLLLLAKSKYRWIGYTVLSIGTFGTWFLGFVIGMMLADAYAQGWLEKLKRPSVIVGLSALAFFVGPWPKIGDGTVYGLLEFAAVDINWRVFYLTIAATAIILIVLLSKRITIWLQKPLLSMLGRYTFSLYLTHLFTIYTVSAGVVIVLHDVIGYNAATLVAALVSIPVICTVTFYFERFVDAPSIQFAKRVGEIYRGQRTFEWRPAVDVVMKRLRIRRSTGALGQLDEAVD